MPARDGAESERRVRRALIVQAHGPAAVDALDYLAVQSDADPTTAADVREADGE
jgi:hypothetical protein